MAAQDVINTIVVRLKQLLGNNDKEFRRYFSILEILSDNRDLKESIKEAEQMLSEIDITRLPSYELGMEKGEEIGKEIGERIGEARGETKGEARGDQKRQLLIAKNMLGKLSDQDILEFTGLSAKALKALKARQRLDS